MFKLKSFNRPVKFFISFLFLFLFHRSASAGCGNGYKNTTLKVSYNKCNGQLDITDLKFYEYNIGKDDYADFLNVYLFKNGSWELAWRMQKDSSFAGSVLQPRESRKLYYGNMNSGNFSASISGRDVDSWWVFANLTMKRLDQDIINSGEVKVRIEAQMHNSCADTAYSVYEKTFSFDLQRISPPDYLAISKNNCQELQLSWQNKKQQWEQDSVCPVTGAYYFEVFNESQLIAELPFMAVSYIDKSFFEGKEYSYSMRTFYRFFNESSAVYSPFSNIVNSPVKQSALVKNETYEQPNATKGKYKSTLDSLIKLNKELASRLSQKTNEISTTPSKKTRVEQTITADNAKVDSIIKINNALISTIASKDSIIAMLSNKTKGFDDHEEELSDSSNSANGDFIVVGVYPSLRLAKYNQQKHGYEDFEIVKSKSGKWYYIAAPLKESDQVLSALKNIRNSTTKNAWWLKLE